MEVEVDTTKGTRGVILAENDRDMAVQSDAMAELWSTAFVSFDGLVDQRSQRQLELVGRLIEAHDVLFVHFHSLGYLSLERV